MRSQVVLVAVVAFLLTVVAFPAAADRTVVRDGSGKITNISDFDAERAYADGDYRTAFEAFDRTVREMLGDGMEPGLMNNLGRYMALRAGAMFQLGRRDEAAGVLVQLVESGAVNVYLPRIATLIIEVMSYRLSRDPTDLTALELRAEAFEVNNDYAEALDDRSKIVGLTFRDEDRARALDSRSWPLRLLGRNGEALADLDEAVRLAPDNTDHRANRARVHTDLGNADAAIADFSFVIERMREVAAAELAAGRELSTSLRRGPVEELAERGKLYHELGMLDAALDDFDAVLERDAGRPHVRAERLLVRLSLVRDDAALEDLQVLRDSNANLVDEIWPKVEETLAARLVPDIAGKAWRMGAAVTLVPMSHLTGRADARAQATWEQLSTEIAVYAQADPAFEGEGLADLPALPDAKRERLQATITFINGERSKLQAMVRRRDGINIADLVHMSSACHLARALHQLGMTGGSAELAAQIREQAEDARLPATVWQDYGDAIESGGDITAAFATLAERFEAFLQENARNLAEHETPADADANDWAAIDDDAATAEAETTPDPDEARNAELPAVLDYTTDDPKQDGEAVAGDFADVVRRIDEATRDAIAFDFDEDADRTVSYRTNVVAPRGTSDLVLGVTYCRDRLSECEPLFRQIHLQALDRLDYNQKVVVGEGEPSHRLVLGCREDAFCEGHRRDQGAEVFYLPCPDERTCRSVGALVQDAVAMANSPGRDEPPPTEEGAGGAAVAYIDIPCTDEAGCKASERNLDALARSESSDATGLQSRGEIETTASSGQEAEINSLVSRIEFFSFDSVYNEYDGARRENILYIGDGADLSADGRLRILMSACAKDCSDVEDDWRRVLLSDLNPEAVFFFAFTEAGAEVDAASDVTADIVVGALCNAGLACVERKDGRKEKRLLIPCFYGGKSDRGLNLCQEVLGNLKALIALHARPSAVTSGATDADRSRGTNQTERQTRETHSLSASAKGLVGSWSFESPFTTPIRIEFRADGTFLHRQFGNDFQGTYTATEDTYAIDAKAGTFKDRGSYRLIDQNYVMFDGQFGVSTWKRVAQ